MEPPDSGHDSKVVIDRLQLTSTIQEYGKGHQHGGYLAFLEIAASMAISVNTIMHQQCF